ncbi:MAG: 30S ribosome-binding factor RbfA [Elusimicrobia bacterium]|nr:30S ribosome-binding factor RbfA [Elusimicrobiota bacterium]
MKASFKRADRLRELFLQEIVMAVRELKDPGLAGFLTITGVDVTQDLKEAAVYYSMLGSPIDKEMAARALERSAGFIQKRLFESMSIRRIPKLRFVYDDTPEKAQRVETLLEQIHADANAGAPPPQPPAKLDSVASKSFPRRQKRKR